MRHHHFLAIILCSTLAACGGAPESPLTDAKAATASAPAASAPVECSPPSCVVSQLHAILRHADDGSWYIQTTDRHWPVGILPQITQCPSDVRLPPDPNCPPGERFLRVLFTKVYSDAGAIQVTPDDDYGPLGIEGFSNLGVSSATIRVAVNKQVIDPRTIRQYAPAGAGNFWITVSMVDRH